jgi:uncharacterized protein (DUF58 family)
MESTPSRLPTFLIIPLVQLFVVLFLFLALLNGQRDLTVLGLVVLVLLIGTKIWSRLSLINISHDMMLDKLRVFPEETIDFAIRIRNAKFLPVLAQLSVSFAKGFKTTESPARLYKESRLFWYQEAHFEWRLIALRRGVFRIGALDLKLADLFGFYPRKQGTASSLEVVVYPRLVALKPVFLPTRDLFGTPGFQSPIEDPVYVYGTREYQSGRPARFIHWKASARLPGLQEKICEPADQAKFLIMVDTERFFKHGASSEFEKILEVAASVAVHFDRLGFAVGLVTNGVLVGGGSFILPVGRGSGQIAKILETLARLQMTPAAKLGDILRQSFNLPWGITGLSLSYDAGNSYRDTVAFFKNRRVPVVSVVCRSEIPSAEGQKIPSGDIFTLEEICLKESTRN